MMHIIDTPEPTTGDEPDLSLTAASTVTGDSYNTNVTTLTERIAIRLASTGAEHPVAAAVTIAMRGLLRHDRNEYADALAVTPADLHALEAGTVPLAELPSNLWTLMHEHGLEPVLLVDLDHQLRGA